jgi:hypothetical protein
MNQNEVREALDKIYNLKNRIKSLKDKGYNPSLIISDDISFLENNLKKEISVFLIFPLKLSEFQRILLFLFLIIIILPITIFFNINATFNNPIIFLIKITFIIIEIIIMFFLLRDRL